jgi:hypothetical protein
LEGFANSRKRPKEVKKWNPSYTANFMETKLLSMDTMKLIARDQYVKYQRQNGHPGLEVQSAGLVISHTNPWIAASPDDRVQDPTVTPPKGLAEYKNPYSARLMTLLEACSKLKSSFCLEKYDANGIPKFRIKKRHDYYFQVQAQMYCDQRSWCDFVLCTEKEIHVERIYCAPQWWTEQLPKLKTFYFHSLLPELACPRSSTDGIRESVECDESSLLDCSS